MQRQSLGSPTTKLQCNGGILGAKEDNNTGEDQRRKDQASSLTAAAHKDNHKLQKPHKSPPPKTEKFVHVIPILTLLCFLILYLSSHDPSQKDLAQFSGFNRFPKSIDSAETDGGFLDIEKADALAIRSLRNLQETDKDGPQFQLHRKIGDF